MLYLHSPIPGLVMCWHSMVLVWGLLGWLVFCLFLMFLGFVLFVVVLLWFFGLVFLSVFLQLLLKFCFIDEITTLFTFQL